MKKIIIISIIIIIGILIAIVSVDTKKIENEQIFHVTLAQPELYSDEVFTKTIVIEKGNYYFRFVPNGSSPETLTINLDGTSFNFNEDFKLKNTLHETGISEYYTWEYVGMNSFEVMEFEQITITINPNGNLMGSVSVDILEE